MKVYFDTIGCRLNQAEIEALARRFRAAGHEIAASPQEADAAVVNTCAVTSAAAADSRGVIRSLARAGVRQIIPTGCWATLHPKEAAELPNVLRVVPNAEKDRFDLNAALGLESAEFETEPISRVPLPGLRYRTRAFVKAQDGCDNQCTFCVTTVARGEGRSRLLAETLADAQAAVAGGAKEVVLTGVHLGSWGKERGEHLRDLIQAVLRETDVPRLRLSSLEPWDLDADFFSLWKDARLAPQLHLPLQSGCDATLRRMARKTNTASFRALVRAARELIPEVAVTTDIIAGFPGETEAEFAETLAFAREMDFAAAHVFTYSPRPGTPAARMKGQVPPEEKKRRSRILREALEESAQAYRARFLGRTLTVLWESVAEMGEWGWQMDGLTGNYLRVRAAASVPRWNEFDRVTLLALDGETLKGEIAP